MTDIVERIRNRSNDAPMPTERLLDEVADEIGRLRNIIRSCVYGAEPVDIGGEVIGLHMPNKHCRKPPEGLDSKTKSPPYGATS